MLRYNSKIDNKNDKRNKDDKSKEKNCINPLTGEARHEWDDETHYLKLCLNCDAISYKDIMIGPCESSQSVFSKGKNMLDRFNSDFDVMFCINHDGDPEDLSAEILLEALEKKVAYLRNNLDEVKEAVRLVHSEFVDPDFNDIISSSGVFPTLIGSKMNTYQLWMEGFCLNGENENATASYIGTSEGVDFRDAVIRWYEKHPSSSFNEKYLSDWGCRIFPTEEEARKNFG